MNGLKFSKAKIVELDGLRGIAILSVMIYHFVHVPIISNNFLDLYFNKVLQIGWIGVDLFFVLSGFLITGILLSTKKFPRYFSSFYYKRSLRIFPLFYLYLAFLFFVFYPIVFNRVGASEQVRILEVRDSSIWFWLYLSNIKQFIGGKLFLAGASHLWSLCVEEQFYLVWPLFVFLFSKINLKKVSIGIIIGCLVFRLILYYWNVDPLSIYVFTLTRIDALVFGALAAIYVSEEKEINYIRVKRLFTYTAIISILILILFGPRAETNPVIYTIGFSLFAATFSLLILLLQGSSTFILRPIFLNRNLVFLGKYSYALYIFHPLLRQLVLKIVGQPKLFFDSQIPWQLFIILITLFLSVIVALFSWHLFEKWFLKLKVKFEEKQQIQIVKG